ncbi:hypothetical protein K491DRAFT_680422 [Lophiostoma macrostomum CBS 122681]|uniref:Uncharacterized protein n=1 Tax=Lophiostoma macrostomum CBS 122681 TaxID=1314788 RepID=A0A6A6T4T8_9PLEO|nr:hypothetical protein K491DRAFT_680422 [Lophiostoma macrostomum CBS 122681]
MGLRAIESDMDAGPCHNDASCTPFSLISTCGCVHQNKSPLISLCDFDSVQSMPKAGLGRSDMNEDGDSGDSYRWAKAVIVQSFDLCNSRDQPLNSPISPQSQRPETVPGQRTGSS